MAALAGNQNPKISCRLTEAKHLAETESAVMDTSDGLMHSLQTLSDLNPSLRMEINLSNVPMDAIVTANAKSFRLQDSSLCFGSAGEYELVSLTSSEDSVKLLKTGLFKKIGSFACKEKSGLHYCVSKNTTN